MAQENENVVSTETTTEVTPTEESTTTETTTAQENVATNEEVVETEDDGEIEFNESDTADDEELNENTKKKQSREKNREYARKRREQQEKDKKTSYYNGVRAAIGEVNPYTNQNIESDEDVQTYLDMKEMEKQGLDPTNSSDYIKFMREKQKVEAEQAEKQQKAEMKKNSELAEFKAKYPTVDIENLVNTNSKWNELIIPQIMQGKTLLEAYDSINDLIQENVKTQAEKLADEKAKKQVQISLASAGSQSDGSELQNDTVDIWAMSNEEFREYQKKRGL